MSWTINLMFLLFITTVTGTVLLGVWYGIGRILERLGYIHLLHRILFFLLFSFLFPALYVLLARYYGADSAFFGSLFLKTPFLERAGTGFFVFWLTGVCVMGGLYLYRLMKLHRRGRSFFPCESRRQELFDSVCDELDIERGCVALRQSYEVQVPEFSGAFHPCTVLPVEEYSDEELRVIFIHELTHYRQRDIWIKHLISLALILHFFNPAVWWLHRLFGRWSEYACDKSASRRAGGMKPYFSVLSGIAGEQGGLEFYLAARLAENKNELLDRVEYMRRMNARKKGSHRTAAAVCMVMLALGSVAVYEASAGVIREYDRIYRKTVTEVMEPRDRAAYSRLKENTDELWRMTTPTVDIDTERGERAAIFRVTLEDNTAAQSEEFFVKDGYVTILADWDPDDRWMRIGLIEPDGTRRFASGEGRFAHEFALTREGRYRIFLENLSGREIRAEGVFLLSD